jgi:hypothetical protein
MEAPVEEKNETRDRGGDAEEKKEKKRKKEK